MALNDAQVKEITRRVMDGVSSEATRRSAEGEPSLSDAARTSFAESLTMQALREMDADRRRRGMAGLTEREEDAVVSAVLAEASGLGQVELLLRDPTVEEVTAVRHDMWYTYHSDGSVVFRDDLGFSSDREMREWLGYLARTKGRTERQFNSQHPLLVMRIGDGLRLAATCEVSAFTTFTLRRNTLGSVSLADLVAAKMFPAPIADLLRAMVTARETRVAIVGATGAGKTTLVRAMLNELDRDKRVVIIEDTAEIDLFDPVHHRNVESWESREANSEGEGAISLSELVKHGLRYRPDLLILGETRDSDAAVPMLKAMTNGQASLTTVHAESAVAGLDKLALYLGTGESTITLDKARFQLSRAIDFAIHVDRGVNGNRFITEILEVSGFESDHISTNPVFRANGVDDYEMLGRLGRTASKIAAAGFDPARLGGGVR